MDATGLRKIFPGNGPHGSRAHGAPSELKPPTWAQAGPPVAPHVLISNQYLNLELVE